MLFQCFVSVLFHYVQRAQVTLV